MSSIEKLSIRGIRSFSPNREELIEFAHPLTVILGDNGCGKTTVIECLKIACTGSLPPGARSGQSFVHDPKIAGTNEVKASVRLRFRNRAGKPMVVQRTFQVRQQKTKVTFKALDGVVRVVNELGEKVSMGHKCGELDRHIPDMLGVSKAILESVIFCHQEESNWPLLEGAVLKKRFDDIFESARYTKALEAIRKLKKARGDDAKDANRDLAVLQVNRKTAEAISDKISAAEDRLQAVVADSERADGAVAEALDALAASEKLLRDVTAHHDALERRREDAAQKESSIRATANNMERQMGESDAELHELLSNYDAVIGEHQQALNALQEQNSQLLTRQSAAQTRYNALCTAQGGVEARVASSRQQVSELLDLAAQFGAKYHFHPQPLSSQDADISAFLTQFQAVVAAQRASVTELERAQRSADDALAAEVSELKARLHHAKEELKAKSRELSDVSESKKAVADRLKELSFGGLPSQHDVEELGTLTEEAEQALLAYKQQHDVVALKTAIQSLKRQLSDGNYDLEELEKHVDQLRLHERERITLDTKRAEHRSKEELFRTALVEKTAEFHVLLAHGGVPTDRTSLLAATGRVSDLIVDKKRVLADRKSELEAAERKLQENVASAKLVDKSVASLRQEKKELEQNDVGELRKLLADVAPGHGLDQAERGVQDAERAYFEAKDKTMRRKNTVTFLSIFKQKGLKEHCCPLCDRGLSAEQEQAFVAAISQKTDDKKVKDKVAKAEALELAALETWKTMRAKLPSWRKWLQLETTIPQRSSELADVLAAQQALQSDVQARRSAVEDTQSQLEDAQRASRELARLSDVADEVHHTDLRIAAETTRLEAMLMETLGANAPSMADVRAKKQAKQAEVQELSRQLQRKQAEKDHANDMQQSLQNDLHMRKEERLKLETQRKEYDDAMLEQSRLRDQEKAAREAVATLTSTKPGLEREVQDKMKEHDSLRFEAQSKVQAQRLELQHRQEDLSVFRDKCLKVQGGGLQKLERELERLSEDIAETKQEQSVAAQALEELCPRMRSAQDNLSQQETFKRHIRDNLDYRALKKDLEVIRVEVKELESEIHGLSTLEDVENRLEACREEVERERESRAVLKGRKQQLRENIYEHKLQLRTSELRDVEEKFRKKLIEFETTQLAVADLDRYYKALDQSLLQYHSKKIEEINTIIRSLWQITYKGQDIDTIELVSGQQEGATTKAARSYDYRVVMKKAGATIDMRGRCSAGQKVLAALVIRLALAETFCLSCGILALDEPTTNLDTENKYGLAQAITDILNARSGQQNFQLVCITHDEEFVQMLSRTQAMDGVRPEFYWRISREDLGSNRFCSKIERREWEDAI